MENETKIPLIGLVIALVGIVIALVGVGFSYGNLSSDLDNHIIKIEELSKEFNYLKDKSNSYLGIAERLRENHDTVIKRFEDYNSRLLKLESRLDRALPNIYEYTAERKLELLKLKSLQ